MSKIKVYLINFYKDLTLQNMNYKFSFGWILIMFLVVLQGMFTVAFVIIGVPKFYHYIFFWVALSFVIFACFILSKQYQSYKRIHKKQRESLK